MSDINRLKRRFAQSAVNVRETLVDQLEKEAQKLVDDMNSRKPIPNIKVDWTWGDSPRGSVTIGQVASNSFATLRITVYAIGYTSKYPLPGGFPAIALWFENGTSERFQRRTGRYVGRIRRSPYFYPTYRQRKPLIKQNLSRAMSRGIRKSNKG